MDEEIGGYVTPWLAQLAAERRVDPSVIAGTVEMTTRGVREQRRAPSDGLQWPVIAVPESASKRGIEPPYVGRAARASVRALCSVADVAQPRRVAVFGAGDIGMAVARAFAETGATVAVADTSPARASLARARGFPPLTRDALARADVVLGATGVTSIGPRELALARDGVMIASVSSRQVEIDIAALAASARSSKALGPRATCAPRVSTARLFEREDGQRLLGFDGYPATLVNPALPDHVRDAVNALALEAVAALAHGTVHAPGVWAASEAIHWADQRIRQAWLAIKPNDGASPLVVT